MSWMNMLSFWQWALLACLPPAIVLLYFLKLKRHPLEVPSTYLWRKSIEDLRVNSIWQRLRRNLLLLLQLVVLLLAMLALARPTWHERELAGDRFVFLVDNSASMSARDASPSRLDEAKRRVGELIDQMTSRQVAMIVSFADTANVEQPFTSNRRLLRRRLDAIRQTNRSTQLGEALRVAAGLANPGRAAYEMSDTRVVESLPATLYIFSDGKFPDVEGFALGNLTPQYVPIGDTTAENVAITAFSTRRAEGPASKLQAFARVDNFSRRDVAPQLELYFDGELLDATKVDIKSKSSGSAVFELGDVEEGALELRLLSGGQLSADDRAWTTINRPRQSRILLVTPGNEPLELALTTERAKELARVTVVRPDAPTAPLAGRETADNYDLVIFDQCSAKEMPETNTLWIGRLPPGGAWSADPAKPAPQIIDVDTSHPLMQLIDLGNVQFVEGTPLKAPKGATTLIEADTGPLMAVASREGFEDAVLGAEIISIDERGQVHANTDWPLRLSFPVFVLNALQYLGGNRETATGALAAPGRTVEIRAVGNATRLTVKTPSGSQVSIARGKRNVFEFNGTEELGIYTVSEGNQLRDRFAVNLFDTAESDIRARPEGTIRIGYVDVKAQATWQATRREAWKALLAVALVVLLFEWYIYNRRVYI